MGVNQRGLSDGFLNRFSLVILFSCLLFSFYLQAEKVQAHLFFFVCYSGLESALTVTLYEVTIPIFLLFSQLLALKYIIHSENSITFFLTASYSSCKAEL